MATGDQNDIAARYVQALPSGWFGDSPNTVLAIAQGAGTALSAVYESIQFAKLQTRLKTSTGIFLDIAAYDFFGPNLPRVPGEPDDVYLARIISNMFVNGPRRDDLSAVVDLVAGAPPDIVELSSPNDCGAWDAGAIGWDEAGHWGDLAGQVLVTVQNPNSVSEAALIQAVSSCCPAGIIFWMRVN